MVGCRRNVGLFTWAVHCVSSVIYALLLRKAVARYPKHTREHSSRDREECELLVMLAIVMIISSILPSFTVSSTALPPLQSSGRFIDVPLPSTDFSMPLNLTTQQNSNRSLSERVLKVQCDADYYGRNLNVRSCTNVFGYLSKDEKQTTFALRHSGIQSGIPLPWRILSGK